MKTLPYYGFAAVSGHPGDWDDLGWPRADIPARFTGGGSAAGKVSDRIECVWSNEPFAPTLF